MSELEIQKRQEYKRNRKKWIIIQIVAIVLLLATALGSFLGYRRMNRTHYIEYMESGSIDYKVHYLDNSFFDSEWIDKDQTYISSLTNGVTADFLYRLKADSSDMGFDYTYKIDAKLLIADKQTGTPYYVVEENVVPTKSGSTTAGRAVQVSESVSIDYEKFDEIANSFVDMYALKNASCTLIVTLSVDALTTNDRFDKTTSNHYSTALNIPVAVDTFAIYRTSSAVDNEVKVLEYKNAAGRNALLIVGITTLVLSALLSIALLAFITLTRNEDITYSAKVRKILKTYGSYIQRMDGEFDSTDYQVVMIKTFTEMLGIRDTLQSPILVFENADCTMTRFFIPTNTKILYVFEIKVDNFDEIYGLIFTNESEEEDNSDAIILAEDVDEEELKEAMSEPDVSLSDIEFVPDDDDDFAAAEDEPGVEVIGVVWPERAHKNKVYRYDPDGEKLNQGDIVLVPTRDAERDREVIRKAAVAHENHRVEPEHIKHPLKKIIGIVKRKVETVLTPDASTASTENDSAE